MAEEDIVKKLRAFLSEVNPLEEEFHVLYFMVEVRKILEHENNPFKYRLLKFYADWVVHTKKDRSLGSIKNIMQEIEQTIEASPGDFKRNPIDVVNLAIKFMYMEELQKEVSMFLKEFGLLEDLLSVSEQSEQNNWRIFIGALIKILVDQPIIKPTSKIGGFAFRPANNGTISATISYLDEEAKYKSFNLGIPL